MSGLHEARLVELVENAHPRRIARHAHEWERCAAVLEDAAARIDSIAARQAEVGGLTGPSMAAAAAVASDVLRVKARDLERGSAALADLSEATAAHQEEKRRLDRDHPDDGAHVVWREEVARSAADSQEAALLRGIAVMRGIEVGEDPRRARVQAPPPGPVRIDPPGWWPLREPVPEPPLDLDVDPDDLDDVPALPQGPGTGVSTAGPGPAPSLGTVPAGSAGSGGSSSLHPATLAG
ncbi:MAG: hypothetical protein JWN84_4370, partial [Nocardioides sp.]|nr:hypothetical protein [Nocardioides sp.]